MKRLTALALCAFFLNGIGFCQTVMPPEYPFNPDFDGDEFVAVGDVLLAVASFDSEYSVEPMMVDSLTIEEAMEQVLLKLDSLLGTTGVVNSNEEENDGVDSDGNSVTTDTTWACGDPVSYWGFQYDTYSFGDQCWFQDNLRTTKYSNGDSILTLSQGTETILTDYTEGACFISPTIADTNLSVNTFGLMYNWYAIADDRGVCPTNWHVPLLGEWISIQEGLNTGEISALELLFDSNLYPGLNSYSTDGFFFTPTGLFMHSTAVASYVDFTSYWTGTWVNGSPDLAWYIDLSIYGSSIEYVYFFDTTVNMSSAMGVRCIKD